MAEESMLLIWLIGAPIAAWITARVMWMSGEEAFEVGMAALVAAFFWPMAVAVGAVAGVVWLFVLSAQPGKLRRQLRRERLRQRLRELPDLRQREVE